MFQKLTGMNLTAQQIAIGQFGCICALVLSFLIANPFGIVSFTFDLLMHAIANLTAITLFLGTVATTTFIRIGLSIVFYAYVFVIMLIPLLTVLCVLAFKTKPSKESFSEYLDNLAHIIELENRFTEPREIKEINSGNGWFTKYSLNGFRNYFQAKVMSLLLKQKLSASNSYVYDCIVCKIAMMNIDGQRCKFVGIFDTWQPLP